MWEIVSVVVVVDLVTTETLEEDWELVETDSP